jgi:hypothetical protein
MQLSFIYKFSLRNDVLSYLFATSVKTLSPLKQETAIYFKAIIVQCTIM